MSYESQIRTYEPSKSIVFLKTRESFGELSNMAAGFKISINGIEIRTSEALYQACRFPNLPEVQELIIGERSPMTAKMRGKPYRDKTREDWLHVRVRIMKWCLQVKLAQNFETFSKILKQTGDRPIVEHSRKDSFWGAKKMDDGRFVGMNVLGRLLMELRENATSDQPVMPPSVPNFILYDRPIGVITAKYVSLNEVPQNLKSHAPFQNGFSFT